MPHKFREEQNQQVPEPIFGEHSEHLGVRDQSESDVVVQTNAGGMSKKYIKEGQEAGSAGLFPARSA